MEFRQTRLAAAPPPRLLPWAAWGISLACLLYAMWGVDVAATAKAFARYNVAGVLLLVVVELLVVLANAVRKFLLLRPRLRFVTAICASFYSLGGNNVLPAKAGDVMASLYLARRLNMSFVRVLSVTIWERLADAHVALVSMAMLAVVLGGQVATAWTGIGLLCVCWIGLAGLYASPTRSIALLRRIPWRGVRAVVRKGYFAFRHYGTPGWLLRLAGGTLLCWCASIAVILSAFLGIADLPLAPRQALVAALIVLLGGLVPSSPGGLGVFEASAVAGLGIWGIAKEEALAIALVCHAIIIGTTVIGAMFCLSSGKRWGRPCA